jgi:hypothetical protein
MSNLNPNNPRPRLPSRLLSEALEYKDMVGMVKPTVHIDEFASKMGDDEDIIVASFFVRSEQAARDLVNWFEKGYDWVLDADRSPGEIRPGRYLVYTEMRRRSSAGRWLHEMLDDLSTLTEHSGDSWSMTYQDREMPFSQETFDRVVPRSPQEYRERRERDLNEMRSAAGIETRQIYQRSRDIRSLQNAAGI